MRWFHNLSTSLKIALCMMLLAAATGYVGWLGLANLRDANAGTQLLYERDMSGVVEVLRAQQALLNGRVSIRQDVIDDDKATMETDFAEITDADASFQENLRRFETHIVTEEASRQVPELRKLWTQWMQAAREVHQLTTSNRNEEARAHLKGMTQITQQASDLVRKLVEAKLGVAKRVYEDGLAAYQQTRDRALLLIALALVAAIVLAIVVARAISVPLAEAVEVLKALAAGDFTRRLARNTKDEVGQMAAALNEATVKIGDALSQVALSAGEVASASRQLSASAEDISSGAQEQASNLQETAASLEEITSTVKQNAENAAQADRLAAGSRDTAEKGGQVVDRTVHSMQAITEASRRIADIITTIDEIAFQTNLLALNAAVEAARAGEQGRGFAVVAAEVRNLAQRSASAAKEIKGLIQDTVHKVEDGSTQVTKSGETLKEIVASVKRVTDIIAEISAGSREQSSGIEQVNTAVNQMDAVTQANASQTEELTATAESLSSQATQLQALVGQFKLDDARRPAAAPRAEAPVHALASAKKPAKGGRTEKHAVAKKPATASAAPAAVVEPAHAANGHAPDAFSEF